jgi:hypothetical protein
MPKTQKAGRQKRGELKASSSGAVVSNGMVPNSKNGSSVNRTVTMRRDC